MSQSDYDTTLARIAGNIASGLLADGPSSTGELVAEAVRMARMIVAEVKHTDPESGGPK